MVHNADDIQSAVDRLNKPLAERFPWARFGEGTYGGLHAFRWDDKTQLTVGNYCSFSFETQIFCGGEHRPDWATTFPFSVLWPEGAGIEGHPHSRGDVTIGSDVWVGAGAVILSGVTIGHGAVIGARSLVTRNVEPYSIVAGSPAKHVSWRFPFNTVDFLLKIKWWDWPRERIAKALPHMLNKDVTRFIALVLAGEI